MKKTFSGPSERGPNLWRAEIGAYVDACEGEGVVHWIATRQSAVMTGEDSCWIRSANDHEVLGFKRDGHGKPVTWYQS